MSAGGRTALLAGATGLVGAHVLDLLLEDPAWERVTVLVRRPLSRQHPGLRQEVVDFDRLEEHAALFDAQDVFCALGTTIRAAGSQEAFRRVDLEYPRRLAELAARGGAEHFLLVSALGADPGSRVFYNRTKGEAEAAVRSFPLRGMAILRPSLLLGERREFRPGEVVVKYASFLLRPLLVGPLRKYRPIHARTVARAMVRLAREGMRGVRVLESDEIEEVGGESLAMR